MDIRDFVDDLARSVAFLSRLPVPERHFIGHDGRLSRAVRAFPLAGLMITLPPAALLSVLVALRTDPLLAALLAVAAEVLITGALHEDGLADTADGIGGGRDRDHALTIMKDSRLGSFGAVALVLVLGARIAAIAAILPGLSPAGAALALVAVAAGSRAAMVWHWQALPPARKDGVAASVGEPERTAAVVALASGAALFLLLLVLSAGALAACAAAAALAVAVLALNRLVLRRIGGLTGDTIGATQQVASVAALVALALVR
ncbi:adenosylcobinamide-GDP ribazoletransferase [Rhizobium sp. TRM95111]|uniref:adenosylcobinamide-GDP ribazoletransferase n=1 Tax=Rhizobium alarense TaxID=2846851 RepID=UPI001F218481|nr:adenosylcobinamide-GDP ribazoletransferase [Rhizobium alarense]MCF3639899.1 adenosylcobinamide-GDP ribazoletransferase [Rhizobium alarense]